MKDKPELYTYTNRENKRSWLVYDETGVGEVLAILRVPKDEFWSKLGKALQIKFVFPEGYNENPMDQETG